MRAFIYRNDDYGKTGMAHFEEVGKGAGFEVTSGDAIAAGASDATTQLTHVKAASPQALICWTTLPSANVIIKGYRELGLQVPIYYSDGAATGVFPKQAGAALNGAFIATLKVNVYQELARSCSSATCPRSRRRIPRTRRPASSERGATTASRSSRRRWGA